jgi:hypothetical protein
LVDVTNVTPVCGLEQHLRICGMLQCNARPHLSGMADLARAGSVGPMIARQLPTALSFSSTMTATTSLGNATGRQLSSALAAVLPEEVVTWTCVPPGSRRMAPVMHKELSLGQARHRAVTSCADAATFSCSAYSCSADPLSIFIFENASNVKPFVSAASLIAFACAKASGFTMASVLVTSADPAVQIIQSWVDCHMQVAAHTVVNDAEQTVNNHQPAQHDVNS